MRGGGRCQIERLADRANLKDQLRWQIVVTSELNIDTGNYMLGLLIAALHLPDHYAEEQNYGCSL